MLGRSAKNKMLHSLSEKIRSLDTELGDLGVYASDLQTIWSKSLYPIIKNNGWNISNPDPNQSISIYNELGNTGKIDILSFSTVKVRKFGDSYKADSNANHREVWNAKLMQRNISKLWKEDNYDYRALIFIGFDYSPTPFRRELLDLDRDLDWASHDVSSHRESWSDTQQRSLSIMLATWEKNQ
jgi:hypothetical protein